MRMRSAKSFHRKLKYFSTPWRRQQLYRYQVEPQRKEQSKPPLYERLGHYTFRALETVALLFVIPTAYVLVVDLEDRQSQRIAQAWQLITQNAPGNSGKIEALEYLNSSDCRLGQDPSLWEKFKDCGITALLVPPKQQVSLTGIDLSAETHSSTVYLDKIKLSGARLRNADLSGAILTFADLSRTDLLDANLSGAGLTFADLSGARLSNTNLTRASLNSTNMSGTELNGANLSGTNLIYANLSGASFLAANLSGARLSNTNLTRASLFVADLSGTDLSNANLSGADFSGATLLKVAPYKFPLTRRILMPESYKAFPWPPYAQTGAVYNDDLPPRIDPSLLVHFTAVGDECTWVRGLKYVECAYVFEQDRPVRIGNPSYPLY